MAGATGATISNIRQTYKCMRFLKEGRLSGSGHLGPSPNTIKIFFIENVDFLYCVFHDPNMRKI